MKKKLYFKSALTIALCISVLACNKENNKILDNKEDNIEDNSNIGDNTGESSDAEEFNNTAPDGKKYIKLINWPFRGNNDSLEVPGDPGEKLPKNYTVMKMELYDESTKDSLVVIGRQIADKYDDMALFTLTSQIHYLMGSNDPYDDFFVNPLRVKEQHFEFNGAESYNKIKNYDAIGLFLQVPKAIKYKLEFYIVQMEKGKIIRRSNTVTYDINTVKKSGFIPNVGTCPDISPWECMHTGYHFEKITVH